MFTIISFLAWLVYMVINMNNPVLMLVGYALLMIPVFVFLIESDNC